MRYLKQNPYLFLLAILQFVVLFPFRFTSTFGERDSYRMVLGLVDTLKSGAYFNSSLLYNREASFGYYALLYALSPLVGRKPDALIPTMNIISFVSAVLFVVPAYIVIERLFSKQIAIASGLILLATPVWWNTSSYGHPITPALLLFFGGLAVLCSASGFRPWLSRVCALAFFTAALAFRFDLVLLFLSLPAVLWRTRQSDWRAVAKESSFYILLSVIFFEVAQHLLPLVSSGETPTSISGLLAQFEQPSHLVSSLRLDVLMLVQGFTFALLLAFPISLVILWRARRWAELLFVSGVIAINLVFWLPNPNPSRHYLMMAPAMSVSAALVCEFVLARMSHARLVPGIVAGASGASIVLASSLALGHGNGRLSYFSSPFQTRLATQFDLPEAERIANGLIHLPPLSAPVIVLCDSNLVIAEMDELAPDTSAKFVHAGSTSVALLDVKQGGNHFIMVEKSWDPSVLQEFDKSGTYPGVPVLAAPYLKIPYCGLRRLLSVG